MSQTYTVKEAGYAYLYVSNEQTSQTDVYFDDVTMTYTPTNVLQYNEYYPFGLQTANSWTRENTPGNNYLANGGTELNTTSSLYDLEYRNYDPVLGRMNQVDPVASKYASQTPYNYCFNSPAMLTDPLGDDVYVSNALYNFVMNIFRGGGAKTPGGAPIMDTGTAGGGFSGGGFSGGYGEGGGTWTQGSGWQPFTSSLDAFYTASAYNERHNSWGSTQYGSFEAYSDAYAGITNEPRPLREVTIEETRSYAGWLQERVDETFKGVDNTTPWQVGWEWLTGKGQRNRYFTNGDLFTEMLRQHDHVEETRDIIRNGGKKGNNKYDLSGFSGVGKYLRDYSTLTTAGATGNLAVTYLGSYELEYDVISTVGSTALVAFTVTNYSTIQSGLRPPVIGYTQAWIDNIGNPLNSYFSSGPMSTTSQTFKWTETITLGRR